MDPVSNLAQIRLIRWSEYQAGIMLGLIGLVLLRMPLSTILILPMFGFSLLIAWNRGRWTPGGRFGAANVTTLLRLVVVLALPGLPGSEAFPKFALALFALALDGLDGWLARRLGLCSEFGATFDQEVDAAFTLLLGVMLFREGLLGPWILIPGGLRYAFVLFVKFARPPEIKETGTFLGKAICVAVLSTLMLCLLPLPRLRAPLAVAATLVLCGSFALSLQRMYKPG